MSDEQRPPLIPSITSYEAARTSAPPPLPVPPHKRMPRWAIAAIAFGILLVLLVVCGIPVLITRAELGRELTGTLTTRSGDTSDTASDWDGYPGARVVKDAKPDAAFAAAMKRDYPAWRFVSGEMREDKWPGGGLQTWSVRLESLPHPQVMLDLEYRRQLDVKQEPEDEWTSDEVFFQAGRQKEAEVLLNRFARDVTERPLVIRSVITHEPVGTSDRRTFRVSWQKPGRHAQIEEDYLLESPGRIVRLP